MKIVLVGANGTIGREIQKVFAGAEHEIVAVGKKSGEFQVDITDRASVKRLFERIGAFDALAVAAGEIAFAPTVSITEEQWQESLGSKFMGQVRLVQEALPYIREKGSFTLITGILSREPIAGGTVATAIGRAIEGFAAAAALELPKGLRINVVSPTYLRESEKMYGAFFPGFIPVDGWKVAQAYKRSILGIQTGRIYEVGE